MQSVFEGGHCCSVMDKTMIDADVLALALQLKALANQLRAKGLGDDDLQGLLARDEKGIALSTDGTLTLLDYGKKIRLNPLERTLYAFFLKHEDGVTADDLWMYYDEMVQIYGNMSRYEDPQAVADAVDTLLDDSRVTLYSNLSRIKRKLTDAAGAGAAKLYAVLRDKDNAYKVAAPRDLVKGTL